MAYAIRFTDDAKVELTDIAEYIARDSQVNAKRFVASLVEKYKSVLGVFPESGRVYKDSIRQLSFKGYTAFYSVDKEQKTVYILHIMNLTKPLDERKGF